MILNRVVSKFWARAFINFYTKGDNWHKIDLKNGNFGYGWLHYAIIRNMRAKKVLCVGSRYGFVPAVCAMACRDNEMGQVDFVDAGYDMSDFVGPGKHWGGVGFWKKCHAKSYFGKFGLDKYIKLFVETTKIYESKNKKCEYDYVYLDGDHSYSGVKTDFELFWPKLKVGGFLAVHDIGSPDKDGNIYGTRKFWKNLSKKYKVVLEFIEDPGLGIVQKIL